MRLDTGAGCRQSILCDKLDFGRSYWSGISEEGRAFVGQLLERDPAKRPSAKQALQHPWLQGHAGERPLGKPLSLSVVQRIQVCGPLSHPPVVGHIRVQRARSLPFLELGSRVVRRLGGDRHLWRLLALSRGVQA